MDNSSPEIMRARMDKQGFTLVELLVVIAIIAILSVIAYPLYLSSVNRVRNTRATADLHTLDKAISAYTIDKYALPNALPDILADTGMISAIDPWGRNYVYFRISDDPAQARMFGAVQMNDDNSYDLYSVGPDGLTDRQLNDPKCDDDVVRHLNGSYLGVVVPNLRP